MKIYDITGTNFWLESEPFFDIWTSTQVVDTVNPAHFYLLLNFLINTKGNRLLSFNQTLAGSLCRPYQEMFMGFKL